MRKVIATAIREYKATALTKAFIFATFVFPVIMIAALGAAGALGLFSAKAEPIVGTIAVIDRTEGDAIADGLRVRFDPERIEQERAEQREKIRERLEEGTGGMAEGMAPEAQIDQMVEQALGPKPEVQIEELPDDAELDAQRQRVRAGDLLAVITVEQSALDEPPGEFGFFKAQSVKRQIADKIERSVEEAVIDQRFAVAGIDKSRVDTLSRRPRTQQVTITETGETSKGEFAEMIVPLASIIIMMIAIFTGAGYLLMSTVEEKNSRVMEVLLSAISPMQLMIGKLVGQGLVGLTTFVVYAAVGVFGATQFDLMELVSPVTLALLLVYFLIGYFMFAAVFAAIGAAVTEIREAQAMQGPIFGITFLFIYAGMFAGLNDPNNTLARVVSFIPPATPFIMPLRIGNPSAPPPAWEIAATIALGLITVVALTWAAAKIFRVGVLMYGKPPSLLGLIKWIRYA